MAEYLFLCKECDEEFNFIASMNEIQSLTKNGKVSCPICNKNKVKRLFVFTLQVKESTPPFEQYAVENPDGSTTITPAAKSLKRFERTIPKQTEKDFDRFYNNQ